MLARALFLGATLVAASQLQLAAAGPVTEDVPVPGGTASIAATLDISPVPDRGRFVSEAARILYGRPNQRTFDADVLAARLKVRRVAPDERTDTVPVPLSARVWSASVFRRSVAPSDLVVAILSDRRAAYLAYGLSGLDDDTLSYLGEHSGVLTAIYEQEAPAFAVFASSLHVRDDRVIVPGGEEAAPLWEAVIGERVARPDRFLVALFAHAEGRTAYLYDTVGQLDPAHQRFALGLDAGDAPARVAALRALALSWARGVGDWRVSIQPFARQPFDPSAMLARVAVDAEGRPVAPASRAFWAAVFESNDLPDDAGRIVRAQPADPIVDAAWLVEAGASGNSLTRGERLDQFAFGQRVFARAKPADLPNALVAVRAFRRYRMLMVTIERMGIGTPSLYASAARVASRMSTSDAARAFLVTAQFQGALALLLRMQLAGTLDAGRTEALVTSLLALPIGQLPRYQGELTRWLAEDLRRAIPPADTLEDAVLAALAGRDTASAAPVVNWEGHRYRANLAASERTRLERVRARQAGPTLDRAIDLSTLAHALTTPGLSLETARGVEDRLEAIAGELSAAGARTAEDEGLPSGVAPPRALEFVTRALDELGRLRRASDLSRASRAAVEILDAVDAQTAQTLVSWAYAVDIGEPDGAALLPGDVSRRHDFGFSLRDSEQRLRAAWALPRQDVAPGVPWHVDGALLGLDVALANLVMRRLNVDRALDAPTLTANERETFAVGYGLMRPGALTDVARDGIASAIVRGRRRVLAISDEVGLSRVAAAVGLDGWRLRAMRWTLAHERERFASLFSLRELVALGDTPREIDLDPWGTSAMISTGCVCTAMPRPGGLTLLGGRPQIGLLATAVPDLNLRVASVLAELRLPAFLAKYVLSAAIQDFIDEVRATDPDDWLTMVRTAADMSRERIEDYIAAATADGPLVPEAGR